MDAETDTCLLHHQSLESNESFKYNYKPLPAMLREDRRKWETELCSDSQGPYVGFTLSRAYVDNQNKMCLFLEHY